MTDILNDNEIKAILQTKILAALKSAPEAIEAMIQAALSKPVDGSTGRFDGGYGSSKVPYLEWLTGQTIRNAADTAVRKVIDEMQPQIESAVREKLSSSDVVDAFVTNILQATKETWRVNVAFDKIV